ncbi:hypothetical protein HaLaN_09218 [Haematococcus lacustris]|uniref:Uncharacterized protein n=1 Tax=Haematococcus lacustris TaxID=44745 RepID=A0A699YU57_HAELA|nr:hypothetical protein HaLaN_09218 [Haematococcus lacustris]
MHRSAGRTFAGNASPCIACNYRPMRRPFDLSGTIYLPALLHGAQLALLHVLALLTKSEYIRALISRQTISVRLTEPLPQRWQPEAKANTGGYSSKVHGWQNQSAKKRDNRSLNCHCLPAAAPSIGLRQGGDIVLGLCYGGETQVKQQGYSAQPIITSHEASRQT